MPKNIALAINEVCRNAVKLNKTNKNNYQDYNFASIDDFLEVYGSTIFVNDNKIKNYFQNFTFSS